MNAVVIVAGGSGRRAGGTIPKQYVTVAGKALVLHTLDRFFMYDPGIRVVLVLAPGHAHYWEEVAGTYRRAGEIIQAKGGMARSDSVRNGLCLIEDGWIVGIHDAVRPFVSLETIGRCYASAEANGSGIPAVEMDESVRMVDPPGDPPGKGVDPASGKGSGERVVPASRSATCGSSTNLDRSRLRRVQTPQVFRSELIKKAYLRAGDRSFTDDASVYESLYGEVSLVEGNVENIKITTPVDVQLAELGLRR